MQILERPLPELIIQHGKDMALALTGVCGLGLAEPWGGSEVAKELVVEPELAQGWLVTRLGSRHLDNTDIPYSFLSNLFKQLTICAIPAISARQPSADNTLLCTSPYYRTCPTSSRRISAGVSVTLLT